MPARSAARGPRSFDGLAETFDRGFIWGRYALGKDNFLRRVWACFFQNRTQILPLKMQPIG